MSADDGSDWKKRTRPVDEPRDRRLVQRSVLHLVRVLSYDQPEVTGSRHRLDASEVFVGRGDTDEVLRSGDMLTLRIADAKMSQRHARIIRAGSTWELSDLGSTNGTWIDGKKVESAELEDGSIVELGGTAFIARASVVSGDPDIAADELVPVLPGMRTFSASLQRELANLGRLATSAQSIVIHGETGTGKEVTARAIHAASGRTGAFVAINCGGLAPNLVESELFGHKKGAFSGAVDEHLGLIRSAHGGTLLLDEIGDLPLSTQATLLRVLQEREVTPLGATRPIAVDVRVIAASHRSLEQEVGAGRFREDLWSRLAGYTAVLPPLRDRMEDLGLLVAALLARTRTSAVRMTAAAGRALLQYEWPRNVRELEQVLRSALALCDGGVIELEHLPPALHDQPAARPTRQRREQPPAHELEDQLRAALRKHGGNISAAGRELGVARIQIHRWLERYGIDIDEYRQP